MIKTSRLILETWDDHHRDAFAKMNGDPEVMHDLGGPMGRAQSDAKFERYRETLQLHGTSRWAVLGPDGQFLGYSGVMFRPAAAHPLGPHYEVGWRFVRAAWGQGFATESASAALGHAFQEIGLREILSYTSADNARSLAVITRLGLKRESSRDFDLTIPGAPGVWRGLVWSASAGNWDGLPDTKELCA